VSRFTHLHHAAIVPDVIDMKAPWPPGGRHVDPNQERAAIVTHESRTQGDVERSCLRGHEEGRPAADW